MGVELKKEDEDHFWYNGTLIDMNQLYYQDSKSSRPFGTAHEIGNALYWLHWAARRLAKDLPISAPTTGHIICAVLTLRKYGFKI